MIERTLRAVHQLRDVDFGSCEIRDRRIAYPQTNLAGDTLVLGGPVELSLKSRHQESRARVVRVRRQNREPQVTSVTDDVRLPALLAKDVGDVGEADRAFLPQHARSHFAIVDLRCESDARKRFVFSESAGAEFSGQLAQTE